LTITASSVVASPTTPSFRWSSGEPAKVRCRTCYHDHDYRHEQAPPSKKDLKKAELFKEVLAAAVPGAAADGEPKIRPPSPSPPPQAAKKADRARQKRRERLSAWDAARYQDQHSFVWRYGANLMELLNPQPGERILDLGCGTGQLTAEIARSGATVIGLDNSAEMLAERSQELSGSYVSFRRRRQLRFPEPFDAVFSNAALHWVKDAEGAVASIARALRPGGRFVAEFGGKGNIASVQAALRAVLGPSADEQSPWYYPSIGEYAPSRTPRPGGSQCQPVRPAHAARRRKRPGPIGCACSPRLTCASFQEKRAIRRHRYSQLVEHLRPHRASMAIARWHLDSRLSPLGRACNAPWPTNWYTPVSPAWRPAPIPGRSGCRKGWRKNFLATRFNRPPANNCANWPSRAPSLGWKISG
jgi:SAM-dependent methyltransferase